MKVVYISGKYQGKDNDDVEKNIAVAELYALTIWEMGMAALCPHLNTRRFEVKSRLSPATFLEGDVYMMMNCDALFMLPSWEESAGAITERKIAKESNIPVFEQLEELERWSKFYETSGDYEE